VAVGWDPERERVEEDLEGVCRFCGDELSGGGAPGPAVLLARPPARGERQTRRAAA
jgi:hypothetical protein